MTTSLQNDSFLRALRREPTEYTPVWLMRQAGRYLPEYRATRARAGSFLDLCRNDELACEVTMQPLERFPLDAAILFSDILTIPDAMGLGLYFSEGEGPRFERPIVDEAGVAQLAVPDPEAELGYVMRAVRTIRQALGGRVPLIGFSGSPWTLACYMVEGGGSSDYRRIRTMLYRRPDLLARILEVNADAVAAYLAAQVAAGAQALMIFDTWGGLLADGHFQSWSLAPMRRVIERLRGGGSEAASVPVIVFTKGGGQWLDDLAGIGADALGLDWTTRLGAARARIGDRIAMQGNLDPMSLMADPEQVRGQVRRVLDSYGQPTAGHGHVFNLGHGISQFTAPEAVAALVDEVHTYSRAQRAAPGPVSDGGEGS
jgi:uroporphyrinogen decarboxylase